MFLVRIPRFLEEFSFIKKLYENARCKISTSYQFEGYFYSETQMWVSFLRYVTLGKFPFDFRYAMNFEGNENEWFTTLFVTWDTPAKKGLGRRRPHP